MIRIIDNTLTTLDHNHLPPKEELFEFCNLLQKIGIDYIEMSLPVFEKMGTLPEQGHYLLHLNHILERPTFQPCSGFYKYVCRHANKEPNMISEFQVNDIREIVQLRAYSHLDYVRIVGLDDLICKNFIYEMNELKEIFKNSEINFCPENSYSSASALAVQWLLNGGNEITSSFNGNGNKAATEEVIMALRLHKRFMPNRDLSILIELTKLYESMTGQKIAPRKPILGKEIFHVEAGIHVDGIFKNKTNYEAYDPAIVGRHTKIILGKHSGKKAVQFKMIENRIPLQKEHIIQQILNDIQIEAVSLGRSLYNEEFVNIANRVIGHERKKKDCRHNAAGWRTESRHSLKDEREDSDCRAVR